MASLVASQTIPHRNPNPTSSRLQNRPFWPSPVSLSLLSSPKLLNLVLHTAKSYELRSSSSKLRVSASSVAPVIPTESSQKPAENFSLTLLSDSTRTVSAIFAVALSISRVFTDAIRGFSLKIREKCLNPTPEELEKIESLRGNLVCTIGPLFFAALRDRPRGYLNTPLTVVASGMAKWLDIYSGVLLVRVLLSWFPNIPWDRQPLSAIRDLCDPYLNLFRNIIPPIFDTLDVSPLLAFAVLGTLGSILNNSRGSY